MGKPERQLGPKYDPILSPRLDSPATTRAFLKNGESLSPIQRAGIFVISFMIIGWAIYFAADAVDGFRSGSPRFLGSCAVSLFLLVFGTLALRNALRFKRRA